MVSLDLSGRNLRGGIFDAANNLIKFIDSPFHGLGPQAVETQIRALVKELVAEPSAHNLPLLGIGVSLPGAIDMQTGDIYDSVQPALASLPVAAHLERRVCPSGLYRARRLRRSAG